MKRYIHLFANESEFDQERQGNYYEPWVSYTKSADKVDYNKTEEEKLLGTPFTVESLGSGNVTWSLGSKTAQYSKNGGEWTNITRSAPIPVVAGDKVSFKGTNSSYKNCALKSTAKFNVMGNIMSLISGSSFTTATVIGSSSAFTNFFSGATMLVSAEKLKLPATTLASNCYQSMFSNCTSLTQAPELPATTLASSCYGYMFYGCTSLTQAPALPATTLASNCYKSMFYGCTSLTQAPELPATTMTDSCYGFMFYGCTSLTQAPEIPATTLASSCYGYMFNGCSGLTQAPALPATTLADYCYNSMFLGCTSLTTAPALPATTLASSCYGYMFYGCTSLTQAPALPATTLADYCYSYMFGGCTSLTTAPELPATDLWYYCYEHMFDSCVILNHVKAMFIEMLLDEDEGVPYPENLAVAYWLDNVSSPGTLEVNRDESWSGEYGEDVVPPGWNLVRPE